MDGVIEFRMGVPKIFKMRGKWAVVFQYGPDSRPEVYFFHSFAQARSNAAGPFFH